MHAPLKPPHVAMLWVDNANLTRCRVVPRARFEHPNFSVQLTSALQSVPCMADVALNPPVGIVHLAPDRHCDQREDLGLHDVSAWMPHTRVAFGDMKLPGDKTWNLCPRSFLRRQERALFDELGVHATVGFELEFQLLRAEDVSQQAVHQHPVPVDSSLYAEVRAFYPHGGTTGGVSGPAASSSWTVLHEIVECLQHDLGIAVYQYHPESASGQFEISIGYYRDDVGEGDNDASSERDDSIRGPGAPAGGHRSTSGGPGGSLVDAVDKLVLARLTVHGIAAKHGLYATFAPKLHWAEAGSGAHVHLGLVDSKHGGKNLFASRPVDASSFVAGILEELPGMLMLLAPSTNSYQRFRESCWAGAFRCYGFENREAAIRFIGADDANSLSSVDHLEVKTVDATANPYVAVGALLAAGLAGVRRKAVLPDPVQLDPAVLQSCVCPDRLPGTLNAAIDAFEKRSSSLWNEVLSEEFASLLVRLRRAEETHFARFASRDEMIAELVKRF